MCKPRFIILLGIIFCSVLYRLIPHPFNFTPIAATALFAGAHFNHKKEALLVTLIPMFFSDLYLGIYNSLFFTYAGLCSVIYIGTALRKTQRIQNIIFFGLLGSLSFYALSNFGVWLCSGLYEHSIQGLIECYWFAIPFLQNCICSMLLFSLIFFSLFSYLENTYTMLKQGNKT